MNKKKWIGATMSVSLIASATQNFAFCDDLVDILEKDIPNNFVRLKNADISKLSEFARHRLRIARDKAVAYGIAGSMELIINKHSVEEAKKEMKNILKELSKEGKGELFYHFLIDRLLNITVKKREEYPAEHDEYAVLLPVIVKTPFKDDKKLLGELLNFGATEKEVLAIYKKYDQKMAEIENEVKKIVDKKEINREDLKAIQEQIKLAENVVAAYYTTPAGYIRYLASRGVFLDKSSFPGIDDDAFIEDISVWYHSSTVPHYVLDKVYDYGAKAIEQSCPLFILLNFFIEPVVKKVTKKIDDSVLYKLLNQDPHMSSMFVPSSFCSLNDTLDYIDFNIGEYIADRAEAGITKVMGI